MKLFKLDVVSDDQPMTEDNFYLWLDQFDKGSVPEQEKLTYLTSLGFEVGVHKLSKRDLDVLGYILEAWYMNTPHTKQEMEFNELFYPGSEFYYIKGKNIKYSIQAKLRKLVADAGWIYEVNPQTTYFEIVDNRLYAKYQQILGQRYLCNITVA